MMKAAFDLVAILTLHPGSPMAILEIGMGFPVL
jgi:hypothetical protein